MQYIFRFLSFDITIFCVHIFSLYTIILTYQQIGTGENAKIICNKIILLHILFVRYQKEAGFTIPKDMQNMGGGKKGSEGQRDFI